MNHSMPGLPVHHQLLELMQTHVHRVKDATQPTQHSHDALYISSVQFSSVAQLCPTLCNPMDYKASLSINSWSLLKFMSIESVIPSNHLILCRPLLLLPSIFPSIRVFSNESALRLRWTKYWSVNFSISPSNEHPELISFRMDWLDFLAVQGTLKSLLQHHSSKASILRCSLCVRRRDSYNSSPHPA